RDLLGQGDVRSAVALSCLQREAINGHLGVGTCNAQPSLLLTRDLGLREVTKCGGAEPTTPAELHIEEQVVTSVAHSLAPTTTDLSEQRSEDRERLLAADRK